MAPLPYMPFYVSDYLSDAVHLSTVEHGAYLLLIMAYWQRGKALPDDDARLARIARLSADEWAACREALSGFFDIGEGEWRHGRVEAELAKAHLKVRRAQEAGVASAQRRFNKRSTDVEQKPERPANYTDTDDDGDGARAPERAPEPAKPSPLVSPEAYQLADEVMEILGIDPEFTPPGWCGAAMRLQSGLASGWQREIVLAAVRGVAARKRDGPPDTFAYLEKPIAREHARQSAPIPSAPDIGSEPRRGNAKPDWKAIAADLGEQASGGSGLDRAASGPVVELLSHRPAR